VPPAVLSGMFSATASGTPGNAMARKAGAFLVNAVLTAEPSTATTTIGAVM